MKRAWFLAIALFVFMTTPVRAQVCTASISSINFGSIAPATDSSANVSGSVTVSCTGFVLTLPVRACISIGTGSAGASYTPRLAANGASTLQYNLYADSTGGTIWGSRRSASYGAVALDIPLTLALGTASGSRTLPFYGRIAAGQSTLVAGTYLSTFSGATQAEMTYQQYVVSPPNCSTVTANSNALSFTVSATVINDCTLAATNINFGTAGLLDGALTATGTLSVACTSNDPYSITLSAGGGSGASVADRRMTRGGGSEQVRYQLYQNAAYSTPWGDGTNSAPALAGTGTGSSQAITVYARVLPQATPTAGTYSDTILATITY
ncbi:MULTISPECIES: spore coat U domain-containing protein [unclassified Caballeronia]|uniref:Csu type fimbrial protein n=1 Tax=unclassified Caballeronia TaxID=2646786 RepID=UPI00285D4522|nr:MULTISPECIES: spore coat U domain-containing protein [unclassified Caballeronia]MDR5774086.1 spore coat U domain-containing protein [Caballeronia sp. LZ002]MDR5849521.1 spore coat U domain-containing protein [Caballeronia sp. LZ003]